MAYEKQPWVNEPSTDTPLSADRLNHMEDGIEAAHDLADEKADLVHEHILADVTDITATGLALAGAADNDAALAALQPELDDKIYGIVDYYANNDLDVQIDASDVVSGKLDINRIPVGNSGSTVCVGNDSRLSDQRTPSDNSVTLAKIQDGAITNAKISTGAAIAKSKLASDVQTSLGKADSSVQKSGSASGMWMGTTLPGTGTAGVLYVVVP
ncbi:minor tail protein [Mycobacterium phage Gaia]|uniref:Minor tail protein n=1 Tax=Mycobacterium phage Gaia TaxID=1486472 RepID=A0A068F4I0_9CAUD|nr:minor tail protein [Mycobacterium phage Gaia]AID58846.1 minor tail protein [Mycobacterium phage Gaia]AYQ99968.1 minor tail protein [Mycobacterium phage Nebkiss]